MSEKVYFSPSLMCMDFLNIPYQIGVLNEKADFLHVDVMDGHYVKNLALSPDLISAIGKVAKIPMDCHLMVTDPADYVDVLAKAGAKWITVHAESINSQAFRIIKAIQDAGCKVGIVLNPATPLSIMDYYLHLVDKITIMSVDPGFAGQPFVSEMLEKIAQAKKLREEKGYHYIIETDGSCNERTFKALREAGTECFILGTSGLFNLDEDVAVAWDKMSKIFTEKTGEKL